ncbi:MarR family winged helix-turn-helix transcriptional regulator [Roseivivax sp. CAU 1761]
MGQLDKKPSPAEAEPVETVEASDRVLHRFMAYHLRRVTNLVQADLARTLRDYDLRMVTMSTLAVIVEHPGLRQSQLADILAIERPNLVAVLDELESRKLVVRSRVPTDRRAHALTATPAGARLAREAIAATEAQEQRLFAALDEQTRATVIAAMTQVRQQGAG